MKNKTRGLSIRTKIIAISCLIVMALVFVQGYVLETEDGQLISAYVPITDASGKVVGVLGSDYNAAGIMESLATAKDHIIIMLIAGTVTLNTIKSVSNIIIGYTFLYIYALNSVLF